MSHFLPSEFMNDGKSDMFLMVKCSIRFSFYKIPKTTISLFLKMDKMFLFSTSCPYSKAHHGTHAIPAYSGQHNEVRRTASWTNGQTDGTPTPPKKNKTFELFAPKISRK